MKHELEKRRLENIKKLEELSFTLEMVNETIKKLEKKKYQILVDIHNLKIRKNE